MSFFGNLFDFNNDSRLDSFEEAADFGAFMHMMDCIENEEKGAASGSFSWDDDDEDDY